MHLDLYCETREVGSFNSYGHKLLCYYEQFYFDFFDDESKRWGSKRCGKK